MVYDYLENKYIYQYKDHLGNVRLSYSKNATTGLIAIEDTNDYYPFGLSFINTSASKYSPSTTYKNTKYNSKELQESGFYDYGNRQYMPDTGRWFVIDPLTEKMRRHSPYNYAFNNPIMFIDPDGMAPETVKPTSQEALDAIKNTLPEKDRNFVVLDKEGNIDREILNSNTSESGNYSNLKELVNSEITVEYSITTEMTYIKNGEQETKTMSMERDENGEALGNYGQTIIPNDPKDRFSSTNGNVQMYTNSQLNEVERALNASH